MGFKVSIIGVKAQADVLLKGFGLTVLETWDDEMPGGEWWVAHVKKTGWTIFFCESLEYGLQIPKTATEVSKTADVLHCYVYENGGASMAEYWSGGKETWSVTHIVTEHPQHLDIEGMPPPQFEEIRERNVKRQAESTDTDYYFSIPVELAGSIIGFEYFDVLEPEDVDVFRVIDPPEV